MLEPGVGPGQDTTRLQTTGPGDPNARLLLGLRAGKRTQEKEPVVLVLVLALVLTQVSALDPAFQPAAWMPAPHSLRGALSSPPVPPAARRTPPADPAPHPHGPPSPVTKHPLLSQAVLDPQDTWTHHHGLFPAVTKATLQSADGPLGKTLHQPKP